MKGRKLDKYEEMMEELVNHFINDKDELGYIENWIARLRGVTYGWNPNTE
ncbi:MAG: hypothetical protein R2685_11035 [Candidatus Nitrosocosmicus sp.]|nr:hypothetical protein [Candidatus Nitrosocosmicus sp.]